jgi:hypothetical protein
MKTYTLSWKVDYQDFKIFISNFDEFGFPIHSIKPINITKNHSKSFESLEEMFSFYKNLDSGISGMFFNNASMLC